MANRTEPNGTEYCSIPCNLCGSEIIETLSLKDRNGKYLRTVICKKCGLIWSDPRPAEEEIKSFYSKQYRKEYKSITRPKKKHVYRDAKEAMKRYNYFKEIIRKGDSLLDIGAGNGVFVYAMRQLGLNAKGIEPDENHARYAIEELQVPVKTAFAQDIDAKESLDIVTLHHVLEHMTNPLGELKKVFAILKEKGHLVVEVPNAEDKKQDPKNRYHKAHIYTFNPETLVALGDKAGFRVVKKSVAPLNGNISLIFQKKMKENGNPEIRNTYSKVIIMLKGHTNFRHYTSSVPYKKFLVNALAALKENMAIRGLEDEKAIIDSVISKDVQNE